MKIIVCTVLICLFALMTVSGTALPEQIQKIEAPDLKPGTVPPDLGLTGILQAPDGTNADWSSLKGKVVVLEFWATWCAPCIAVQPHLNELTEEFKDKPVQFISVTNEDEATVKNFLKRRQIKGWIGLDTNHVATRAYGAFAIPKTVVVGTDGKIAALPFSDKLTSSLINEVIQGTYVAPPVNESGKKMTLIAPTPLNLTEKEKDPAQLSFSIKPSKAAGTMMGMNKGKISATGAPLGTLLASIMDVPKVCVKLPADLQDSKYDLAATWLNDNSDVYRPWLVNSIETALGLKITRAKQEMDTYVVTVAESNATGLRPSTAKSFHSSSSEGILAATASDLKYLMSAIEKSFQLPVINETGLQGRYDWNIYFDSKNPNSLLKALKTDAGLKLTKTKRQIDVVIVEQVSQTADK